jgi:hypothetical protein
LAVTQDYRQRQRFANQGPLRQCQWPNSTSTTASTRGTLSPWKCRWHVMHEEMNLTVESWKKIGRMPVARPMRRRSIRSAYCHQSKSVQCDRVAKTSAVRHWPLSESNLDYSAETRGWEKIECERSEVPMVSYKKDGVRLNF